MTRRRVDVVVVGSGVAGLSVALRLARTVGGAAGSVVVLSKSGFSDGSSVWAQGGIACALGTDDSPALHAEDTLRVAGGLGTRELAAILTAEAPERIRNLIRLGARFDPSATGEPELGLEGGHSRHRILHAGGDTTGAEVMRALAAAVRECPSLEIVEWTRAADLVLGDGRVIGLRAIGPDGRTQLYETGAVVLAAGGYGHAFSKTTNPAEATGDAVAIAARAGAVVADLEFVQFHPTALDVGTEPMPLLTEALRGAGATLVDDRGRRFMSEITPHGELGPRDVVARAIWERIARGERVYLDARAALRKRPFPTAVRACGRHGLDPARELLPVSPAAHYTMGGVAVDALGRSSVSGLWATGEAAGSGLHGANRLASNSLLEGLVFGARVADDIASRPSDSRPRPLAMGTFPREEPRSTDPRTLREIRTLLWERAGLVRTEHGLVAARRRLEALAAAPRTTLERDLTTVGLLIVSAALTRKESRGAHYRRDFADSDPAFARRLFFTTDPAGGQVRHVRHVEHAPEVESERRPSSAAGGGV